MDKLKRKKFVNRQSVDIVVKDVFGREHVLFPNEEKEIIVFAKKEKGK